MKEEMGKFFCPKCNKTIIIFFNENFLPYYCSLFRMREKNGINKYIFKNRDNWIGDIYNKYSNIKDCWDETGGFSEQELDYLSNKKWGCSICKFTSNSFKTFIFQRQSISSEENNKLEKLENEIQEEKNKNILLNEKLNLIMTELKEIKASLLENKKST